MLRLIIIIIFFSFNAMATPYSMEHIEGLIKRHNIKSVDGLLEKMPTPLFENYALMYFSQSLQEASFMNPRAIVFNDDASFVFTFNGHKEQRGYNTLEVMEFDFSKDKFEFHEVDFSSGKAKISYNDAKCLNCHRQDPRPNWDRYATWPGAYGSIDDIFNPRERRQINPDFTIEIGKLYKFLDIKNDHSRYKNLAKFLKGESDDLRFIDRPNSFLTFKLHDLNARRIVRLIKQDHNASFSNYKYLMLGSLLGCRFEKFFPKKNKEKFKLWIESLYKNLVLSTTKYDNSNNVFYHALGVPVRKGNFEHDTDTAFNNQQYFNPQINMALLMYLSSGDYTQWHSNVDMNNLNIKSRGSGYHTIAPYFAKNFMSPWRDWPIRFLAKHKPSSYNYLSSSKTIKACNYLSKKSAHQLEDVDIDNLINEANSLD